MEDMKKNTGKKEMEETEELEISQRMSERADDIDNATYRYLAELLELNEGDPEEKFQGILKFSERYSTVQFPPFRNTGMQYVTRMLPRRKAAGSTAAHFPSVGVGIVTVRMTSWKKKESCPALRMPLHAAG